MRHKRVIDLKSQVSSLWKNHKAGLPLLLFCVIVACLFTLSPRLISLAYGLIDPSFNYAVDTAGAQKLAFGTTFIATYGPLGYLVANYLPERVINVELWLTLYALLTGIGVYIFSRQYVKDNKIQWVAAFALLYALNISARGGFIEWGYLGTFLLYCFIYIRSSAKVRRYVVVLLSFIAVIFSLTKFTLGAGSVLTLLLLIVVAPLTTIKQTIRLASGAVILYAVGLLVLGRHLGITSIPDYIKTGVLVSEKFSSAMSFYDPQTLAATWIVFITLLTLVLWIVWREKRAAYRYLFVAPALVLVWKYCVVRQDGHIVALIPVILPVAALYYFATLQGVRRSANNLVLVFIVVASFTALWANKIPFYGQDGLASMVTSPFSRLVHVDIIKFVNLGQQKKVWTQQSAGKLGGAALPASMRQEIGTGGVDVFPWETDIIAANNLRWQNRPSPFSFETYAPYLDNLNATFMKSNRAPEYIVWHSTSGGTYGGTYGVDFRNVLWDEPNTLRAILANYSLEASNQNFMLLQKRPTPERLVSTTYSIPNKLAPSPEWIKIPQTSNPQLQFMQFTVDQTLLSKASESLIRGSQYYLRLKTQQNQVYTYKFVKDNSSQGFLINDLPLTWDQLVYFMKNHQLAVSDKVQAFQLTTQ